VLWVNLHSGFLLGLAFITVYIVGNSAEYWLRPDKRDAEDLTWTEIRSLGMVLGVCALVSVANPHGFGIWFYPFLTHFGNSEIVGIINEWKSPDFTVWYFWFFEYLMMLGFAVMLLSHAKVRYYEMIFFFGLTVATLHARRNMLFFFIPAIPIISRHLSTLLPNLAKAESAKQLPRNILIVQTIIVFALVGVGVAIKAKSLDDFDKETRGFYPVDAVQFIKANDLQDQHIANYFGWGGYLIWNEIPVYIDGRNDVYGEELLHKLRAIDTPTDQWDDVLAEYQVNYVLVPLDDPLAILLEASPDWEPIYTDDIAVIYGRVTLLGS
jgi:hypothetical protein